jgi:hypothetical protein
MRRAGLKADLVVAGKEQAQNRAVARGECSAARHNGGSNCRIARFAGGAGEK